jgi:hypothetical protein
MHHNSLTINYKSNSNDINSYNKNLVKILNYKSNSNDINGYNKNLVKIQ